MEHYGIRGEWNQLFRSYFSERKQFVRLENANSILRNSLNCSIVQGSRLSGTMFNLYNNEIPRLPLLLNSELGHRMIGINKIDLKGVSHHVVNFIDDSTNIIGFKEHNKIKSYVENYYKLLLRYYNTNKLKINNDKNKLLLINKPKLDNVLINFSFRAGDKIVKCKNKIKVLGTWVQKELKMECEINKLSSTLHNRINSINKIKKFTDFKTRLNFLNSFVIGKLIYMLPLYNSIPGYLKGKLHKIIMKTARSAIGDYCYRKSTSYILNKCKFMNIENMIKYSSLVFINNLIRNKKPKSIMNIYRKSRISRHRANISLQTIPKGKKYSNFFIQAHTSTYNEIPYEITSKSKAIFKKEIKLWILNYHKDTMD